MKLFKWIEVCLVVCMITSAAMALSITNTSGITTYLPYNTNLVLGSNSLRTTGTGTFGALYIGTATVETQAGRAAALTAFTGTSNITTVGTLASVSVTSAKSPVNGSVSGVATFEMPFTGTTYKKVLVKCTALSGEASYTFPVAFTDTPVVLTTSGLSAGYVSTLDTTHEVVRAATATSGILIIEGY